jgi:hypothetical protein
MNDEIGEDIGNEWMIEKWDCKLTTKIQNDIDRGEVRWINNHDCSNEKTINENRESE